MVIHKQRIFMTQLLVELLQINGNLDALEDLDYELYEGLGKLNVLNKTFLRMLRKRTPYSSEKRVASVRDELGQDSEVVINVEGNPNEMLRNLTENPSAVALVVKYNKDQVLAVIKEGRRGFGKQRDAEVYSLIAEPELFKKGEKGKGVFTEEEYRELTGQLGRDYEDQGFTMKRLLDGVSSITAVAMIRKLFKAILTVARKENADVRSMTVMADKKRAQKRDERAEGRKGADMSNKKTSNLKGNRISVGGGKYQDFESLQRAWSDKLSQDIKTRLDKFKSSKAPGGDSPEELLKLIMSEGYLDKIRLGEMVYNIGNARIFVDELKKKVAGKNDRTWEVPKIEYNADRASAAYKELRKKASLKYDEYEAEATKKGLTGGEKGKFLHAKMTTDFPPTALVVHLTMKGGAIVPERIEGNYETYGWL